jgi:glycosyltransferase involved in cell wall biosynthesis
MLSIRNAKKKENNEIIEKYNLNWTTFPSHFTNKIKYSGKLKYFLLNIIKKKEKIIFHTHNLWNYVNYITHKLSNKYQIPSVISLRGSIELNSFKKKIAWQIYQKKIFQDASIVHVVNEKDIDKLRKLGISTPIAFIPNGIDLNEFTQRKKKITSKKNLGLPTEKKYILFLSRIHPEKGLMYLVKAWHNVCEHFPNWNLLIVGPKFDIKYYKKVHTYVKKYNLISRFHFMGMLIGEKKLDCYNASSLFVLPSYGESFGNVIAEAMAAKLPIITTKKTPWEKIEKYDAGWWVELNLENIISALTKALCCNDLELKKKGQNSFKIIKQYAWKDQSAKMKKVYDWVFDKEKKPKFIFEVNN